MASSISMSEEQFLCSICLDTFTRPVSTPCGHNFCLACITRYWDDAPLCQCPLCKETFQTRPHLKVNTFISELASQFLLLQVTDARAWSSERPPANSGAAVLCDVCTDAQRGAVRSCLECVTSYCDLHLEPHHRAAGLRRHTLVDPLEDLEARMCKEHNRLLRLFCRRDNVLLCDVCSRLRNLSHHVVPVQQAFREMRDELEVADARAREMIRERQEKVQATRASVQQSQRDTGAAIARSTEELAALASEIQRSQAELVQVMEERQKAAEEEAEGFIGCLERDVAQLEAARGRLRELEAGGDQLRFLQEVPDACVLPRTADPTSFSFHGLVRLHHLRTRLSSSVAQLKAALSDLRALASEAGGEDACDGASLATMRQHEVSVVLDALTAHPLLVLSDDRKEVRFSGNPALWRYQSLDLSPSTFTEHLAVLGEQGFVSCRFYFEVFVGRKSEWCLGVAKASVQRSGGFARTPQSGLWALWFLEDRFETFSCPGVPVRWGKVERVGVFVDYDGGRVSFCDVQAGTLIYSITECLFTEPLHPYFNPCDNEYGSNLDPMVIVPVGTDAATATFY
ncbi:E3 ubiquitin-protein ligase TRIM39-like [Betta splendens]|uniref:E3 ubiquitin-protein ligase TRIM39-like n=1 Tax=Betta splendens TaxID=158456 RepID=A0A6P7L5H1_BETSP|nr:E3 ubiquitin-protein ligase TRIM39-like [Betta splendens]XP_028989784.1 E3 ubiquitin-protein ligase TRIM39-like [Betta splendens]